MSATARSPITTTTAAPTLGPAEPLWHAGFDLERKPLPRESDQRHLPEAMYENGFTDLISVVPPGATLSPGSKLKPTMLGKAPGRRNKNGTWAGYDWRRAEHSIDDVLQWRVDGANVGLKADRFPGLDIDCENDALATLIEAFAVSRLGEAPVRYGKRPKRLLMYGTPEPFGRIRLWITKENEKYLVEVLGTGQQYLVYGRHPAGMDYEWTSDITQVLADSLTPITREQVIQFRMDLGKHLNTFGYTVEFEGDGQATGSSTGDQAQHRAPSMEVIYDAVSFLPNTSKDFGGRQEWLDVGYAIKSSAGIENEHEARELFLEWSLKWPGDQMHPEGNDPAAVLEEFRRLVPPYKIGWNWLQERARGFGYNNASDDFDALDPAPPTRTRERLIDKANAEFAVVEAHLPDVLWHAGTDGPRFLTKEQFLMLVQNRPRVPRGNRSVSFATWWLEHPERLTLDRVVLDPRSPPQSIISTPNGRVFNMWSGFPAHSTEHSCDLILAHLRDVVCSGNAEHYEWVMNWLAAAVQDPGRLPGTALVLRGKQGVGKTKVCEILRAVVGDALCVTVSKAREILGDFNSILEGRVFVFAEEAFFAGDRSSVGALKNLLTSPQVLIQAKYHSPHEIRNLAHVVMTTNDDWAVPAGKGERRFTVLDVADTHRQDFAYFAALDQELTNGGAARLLHHLRHERIVDWQMIRRPLETEALLDQQLEGLDGRSRWWLDRLTTGSLPDCSATALHSSIDAALGDQYERVRSTHTKNGTFLKKVCGATKTRSKRRGDGSRGEYKYAFPPLAECRRDFARDLAVPPTWDEEVTEWQHAHDDIGELPR